MADVWLATLLLVLLIGAFALAVKWDFEDLEKKIDALREELARRGDSE